MYIISVAYKMFVEIQESIFLLTSLVSSLQLFIFVTSKKKRYGTLHNFVLTSTVPTYMYVRTHNFY